MEEFLHAGMPWKIFNFIVFVGLLSYLLKNKVVEFWCSRRDGIQSQINEARQLLAVAEVRSQKLQVRAEHLEQEMSSLVESLKREGEMEKKKIMERAEQQSARLREDTEKIIEQEFKRAQEFLKREIVLSAVQAAENMIREKMTPEDQRKLNEATLKSLGQQWQ